MEKKYNVKELGQVFTNENIVEKMLSLRKNNGNVLEPSCGDGAFSNKIKNCIALELDKTHCPNYALNMDFFDYDISNKFETIIGNPPYVKHKDILKETKDKLNYKIFDKRANLYLFFIYKSILHLKDNGELIFLVPRAFLKATSCIKLNMFIYSQGTITDIIDLGDNKNFKGYSPNCIIFRFEKGNYTRITNKSKTFKCINGQLIFTNNKYSVNFNNLFYVKIGGVSGLDSAFDNEKGNIDIVCSKTKKTNKTKKMFYNIYDKELETYKNQLLNRKIRNFNENNWYMWGRNCYVNTFPRIYVNYRTRNDKPFFIHSCNYYDGSILGIFPKFSVDEKILIEICEELNNVDWDELGFMCENRYLFSQNALENTILPKTFLKYMV